ncbi:TolC family protein [Synechococcus sp. CS-1328]|nr:TolC family protein [Synechococcus sp. CS-1328]
MAVWPGQPGLLAPSQAQTNRSAPLPEGAPEPLERSWRELDQQLRTLDTLLPQEPEAAAAADEATPPLPETLLAPNREASGSLPAELDAPAALSLPTAEQLGRGSIQGLSLEQALAMAFRGSAELQGQREQVAAALAELQAALGTYWPRISAVASGGSSQSGTSFYSPVGNTGLGFGPQFSTNGLATATGQPTGGALTVPNGGGAYLNESVNSVQGGLELQYALLDFARTPQVRAARARLQQSRQTYANDLRRLQLQVSEAYYQLQQADQLVRIRDATVRNDLVILQDALDLKQAGLVPRLDVLRRRAIEASDQELLIQAMADRAVARRQLGVVLNLPPEVTPSASDPIQVQPRWPLDLESSLLAAYRDNPELEAVLATREALAREKDSAAAALLPTLSLFAAAGGYGANTNQFDISVSGGGCCGSTVIPVLNTNGYDWSIGLTLRWLLFDGGTTAARVRGLARREAAAAQQFAARRNDIRLRLEQAFFNHEASLAKLSSARRGVAAAMEAFRDVRLRYRTGLSNEVDLSITQERLINSLVQRLNATVNVNLTYARLLRELLPVSRDPDAPYAPELRLNDLRLSELRPPTPGP